MGKNIWNSNSTRKIQSNTEKTTKNQEFKAKIQRDNINN